ncbi:MAG: hypothetical protein WAU75_03220 [Solirubrobacteraceae bacterium]
MAEDVTLAVLFAVRDVGLDQPGVDELAERVRQTLAGEIARERAAVRPTRVSRRWWRAGSLVVVLSTLVTVAVVVGLFALLRNRSDGGSSSAASAKSLIARLAVLRRPQAAADVLPARPKLVHLHGTIIPSLTRLVASPPGARLYLVVSTPDREQTALWDPKLGDQVSIVTLTAHNATDSLPLPAAGLSDAHEVFPGGRLPAAPVARSHRLRGLAAYEVSVIPDGVARVRWTFYRAPGKPPHTVQARVGDNVAYAPYGPAGGIPRSGRWYAANGTVIPTSGTALRQAEARQEAAMKAAAIHQYAHYSYRAPASLLASFAVFSITSRTPVHTASGVTISRPALSSLPFTIVNFADPRQPPRLDPSEIRQVTIPSGLTLWVIPGERGLCVAATSPPTVPDTGGGGGEGCTPNLTRAERSGSGFSSGGAGRPQTTYEVLPKSRPTLRIRTGPHTFRTIRPPYGVYIATSRAYHH